MLHYASPRVFLALPVLVGLLLLPLLRRTASPRRRRVWASFGLRMGMLTLLVAALAGPQRELPSDARTVMFLLDHSDSISTQQRTRATTFIRQSLAAMPLDMRAGLVVFGQHALVERQPDVDRTLDTVFSLPGGTRTNIAEAIQLGLALLPADGERRMVLLSDGGENSGDAEAAAQLAASRGIPLEVVALSSAPSGSDTLITDVSVPAQVRVGQTVHMTVSSTSTNATTAQLVVTANGSTVANQTVSITRGANQVEVVLPEPTAAFTRYNVHLAAQDDTRPENNRAAGFTTVSGRPRVLLVEGQAGAARNLADALQAAKCDTETVAPAALPTTMTALARYDAVALIDVPLQALPAQSVELLPAYVRDLGRGLAMIGGVHTFGMGGYARSPIEDALPVTMDVPPQEQILAVSVVVVMDTSGSMGATEGQSTKIHLAATGVARIAAQLRDTDEMTVIPFDHEPHNTIGPLAGTRRDELIDRINHIGVDGSGITSDAALAEAARYLHASTKPTRHVIVLADGDDVTDYTNTPALVQQLNREGVTVTTVAIGSGSAVNLLKHMSELGSGRFFLSTTAANVPNILLQEIHMLLQPLIVEDTFTPLQTRSRIEQNGVLRGMHDLPPLHGYVATTARPSAQVVLATPRDQPLLAVEQYGLGRSLVWTSDLQGQWASDWVRWRLFPQFVAQIIGWLVPPAQASPLQMTTQVHGDTLDVHAQVLPQSERLLHNGRVTGNIVAADGTVRPVTLRESGLGSYIASVSDAPAGTYQVQLVATKADGQPVGIASGGAVIADTREYQSSPADSALLQHVARVTNGRFNPSPYALYDPTPMVGRASSDIAPFLLWSALLLLPLELLVRRWPWARPG